MLLEIKPSNQKLLMPQYLLVLIAVLLILILIVLVRLYLFIRPDDLREGDIVIVTNPHCEKEMMNMVTQVIGVLSPYAVQVRGIGTTVSMNRKWVRRIDVWKGSSIKVPEEPKGKSERCLENDAKFREIPLRWFSYDLREATDS